jgi:hypothetical protein
VKLLRRRTYALGLRPEVIEEHEEIDLFLEPSLPKLQRPQDLIKIITEASAEPALTL